MGWAVLIYGSEYIYLALYKIPNWVANWLLYIDLNEHSKRLKSY